MADDKYATFKREDAIRVAEGFITFKVDVELVDAVVIRRRDMFASPCLATYANMIAMVATHIDDKDQAEELLNIADYFDRQASLAADEGFKLPDV
jgi:hypothetical protein